MGSEGWPRVYPLYYMQGLLDFHLLYIYSKKVYVLFLTEGFGCSVGLPMWSFVKPQPSLSIVTVIGLA
uniref:Uncharacterized protein n=1 Tax=Anguilla anguilla TaxID=7936 RepID=A0A0E9X1T3_ANGAN